MVTNCRSAREFSCSVIIQDPENTNIMYLGTGESYTAGDAMEMVYKSTDGGNN